MNKDEKKHFHRRTYNTAFNLTDQFILLFFPWQSTIVSKGSKEMELHLFDDVQEFWMKAGKPPLVGFMTGEGSTAKTHGMESGKACLFEEKAVV